MTVGELEGADPTDLAGLREALGLADPAGKLGPVGMGRIEIGPAALYLPKAVSELVREGPGAPHGVLAMDTTPMRRAGEDLKAKAERLLEGRFEVRRAVLGEGRGQLHADERALSEAEALVAGATMGGTWGHSLRLDWGWPWIEATSSTVIRPGICFAIERRIEASGIGGANHENNVIVTDAGPEILTPAPDRYGE
jgi:hypothetical protein